MKPKLAEIILLLSFLLLAACKKNDSCGDGYILIPFIGDINHPVYPILLRTSPTDTAYRVFIGNSKEHLEKNEFIVTKKEEEYMLKLSFQVINKESYIELKHFIIKYMYTGQVEMYPKDFISGYYKVILKDRCDFVTYFIRAKYWSEYYLEIEKIIKK